MKARWHAGELIRNRESGSPYFVVHVYKGVCTLIFDATAHAAILPLGILMVRDYSQFARDIEMDSVKRDLLHDALIWKYSPLPKINKDDNNDPK